jgi:hypothetical protein
MGTNQQDGRPVHMKHSVCTAHAANDSRTASTLVRPSKARAPTPHPPTHPPTPPQPPPHPNTSIKHHFHVRRRGHCGHQENRSRPTRIAKQAQSRRPCRLPSRRTAHHHYTATQSPPRMPTRPTTTNPYSRTPQVPLPHGRSTVTHTAPFTDVRRGARSAQCGSGVCL